MSMIEKAIEKEVEVLDVARKSASGLMLDEESEESFKARIAELERVAAEQERERVMSKVQKKLGKMRSGGGFADIKVPKMTKKLKKVIKNAWSDMLGMCDGAQEKDGMGFNKPDAAVAHWAMPVLDSDEACELAWLMLRKYRGQLEDDYPVLY
jgi:hypothetical protein